MSPDGSRLGNSGPGGTPTGAASGLVAERLSKSFYGNRVLTRLDLAIPAGSVHALLGHNGSGKSTFIKILAGYYLPDEDSGSIHVNGAAVQPGNPESSRERGITFVHQTLGLVPSLSVLENLRLGKVWHTNTFQKISWRRERASARASLEAFGLTTNPDTPVGRLSVLEQTEIAVVRALSEGDNISVLVLDEPTAALTDHEVEKLFTTLVRVKENGVAILYVTHRLEEIGRIADQVTVLRDGHVVGTGPTSDFPTSKLVRLIIGDSDAPDHTDADTVQTVEEAVAAEQRRKAERPLLRISGLTAGELDGADLEGWSGEVLGAVGLLGSGIIDVARALTGRTPIVSGSVEIGGKEVSPGNYASMVDSGFGAVVGLRSDRVLMGLTVKENLTLGVLPEFVHHGFLNRRAEKQSAQELVERYQIRCPSVEAETAALSGGNQQKVAITKVLSTKPRVLLLEEPCHGVDARGRQEIREMLRAAAADGTLVLLVDSDLDEVVGLCSRVIVFRDGKPVAAFERDLDRGRLLDASYGTVSA